MQLVEIKAQVGVAVFETTEVERVKSPLSLIPYSGPWFITSMKPWWSTNWTLKENATHLLVILQGQAFDIVHSVPTQVGYGDITEALEIRYCVCQLFTTYHSQLRAGTQLTGKLLKSFQPSLSSYPEYFIQRRLCICVQDKQLGHEIPLLRWWWEDAQQGC
jgi:hypothetical protein